MTRPVLWSDAALDELDKSMAYSAERSPAAACKVLAEIRKTGGQLGVRAIGRPGRVTGTYEKSVTDRPYLIAYTLAPLPDGGACVAILHVRRSRWTGVKELNIKAKRPPQINH